MNIAEKSSLGSLGIVVLLSFASRVLASGGTILDPSPDFACQAIDYSENVVVIGVDIRPGFDSETPPQVVFPDTDLLGFLLGPNPFAPTEPAFTSMIKKFTKKVVSVNVPGSKTGGWYYLLPMGYSGDPEYYCETVNNGLGNNCYVWRILADTLYSVAFSNITDPSAAVASDIWSAIDLARTMTHAVLVVGGMEDDGVFLETSTPVLFSPGKEKLFNRQDVAQRQDPDFPYSAGGSIRQFLGQVVDDCASWSVVTAQYFRDNQASFINDSLNAMYYSPVDLQPVVAVPNQVLRGKSLPIAYAIRNIGVITIPDKSKVPVRVCMDTTEANCKSGDTSQGGTIIAEDIRAEKKIETTTQISKHTVKASVLGSHTITVCANASGGKFLAKGIPPVADLNPDNDCVTQTTDVVSPLSPGTVGIVVTDAVYMKKGVGYYVKFSPMVTNSGKDAITGATYTISVYDGTQTRTQSGSWGRIGGGAIQKKSMEFELLPTSPPGMDLADILTTLNFCLTAPALGTQCTSVIGNQ